MALKQPLAFAPSTMDSSDVKFVLTIPYLLRRVAITTPLRKLAACILLMAGYRLNRNEADLFVVFVVMNVLIESNP